MTTGEELATWGAMAITFIGGAFGLGQNKQRLDQHSVEIETIKANSAQVPERLAKLETHIENIKETNQAILEELRK